MPAKKKTNPLAQMERLLAGQRRDFDELARVLSLRDQLADNHYQSCAENSVNINGLREMVINLQYRLNWYETRVPALGKEKKRFDVWMVKELARRKKYIKSHPEMDEPTKRHYALIGKAPKAVKPKSEDPHIVGVVERQSGS